MGHKHQTVDSRQSELICVIEIQTELLMCVQDIIVAAFVHVKQRETRKRVVDKSLVGLVSVSPKRDYAD